MRVCQLTCVGLALILSSCASWHRPDTVYHGRETSSTSITTHQRTRPTFPIDDDDAERPNGPRTFDLGAPTLTPPVDHTMHRTGYRADIDRAQPLRRERPAPFSPGPGYVELPPAPDLP